MTRTITLLLSSSALALAACADEVQETENAAETAATETEQAAEGAAREASQETREAGRNAEQAMDDMDDGEDGDASEGLRYTEGDETPEDDLGQNPAVNLAQDVAAGPAGMAAGVAAGLSGDVEAYVRNAALGNMYEIQAGRIAQERGNSEDVREIGRMLVADHEQLQGELEASIGEAGLDIALPTELEGRRQGLIDNLNAASDIDFDAAFLHQQEAAHIESVALHEGFEVAGEPEALTDFAGTAGDLVQGHLGRVTENLPEAVDGE